MNTQRDNNAAPTDEEITRQLGALPALSMPPEVADRLHAALAHEMQHPSEGAESAVPRQTPPQSTSPHSPRSVRHTPWHKRRSTRMALLGLISAMVMLTSLLFLVAYNPSTSSDDAAQKNSDASSHSTTAKASEEPGAAEDSSQKSAPDAAAEKDAELRTQENSEPRIHLLNSGSSYTRENIIETILQNDVTQLRTLEQIHADSPEFSSFSQDQLSSCVDTFGDVASLIIDFASFENTPALLVLSQKENGTDRKAIAVGAQCGISDRDELYAENLD